MTPAARSEEERALLLAMTCWPQAREGIPQWLKGVIGKLAAAIGAQRCLIEIHRSDGDSHAVSFHCSSDEEAEIRAATSRGIVAEAVGSGKTLHVPLAFLDSRFQDHPSVQGQRLEAVLCVPLTGVMPGVLYVEGRRGAGPFDDARVALAEHVAAFLARVLEFAVPTTRFGDVDPTGPLRQRLRLDGIAGHSQALARVFEQLALAAPLDITVLLTGESGTGKTQLARALHDNSPRRDGPFVELNCAAIPEGLFESELFGTREGAFTGARELAGKVAAAEGGTLFLDEISEIPLPAQGKLLQVLQSKQYYALASTQLRTANVRLVAASNSDLERLVAERRFREDLFYRLSAFALRVPTLAERRDDIGPILEALGQKVAFEHSLPRLPLSLGFRTRCETMEWPGNVRQLRHRLEQALIRAVAEQATQLEARHLEAPGATRSPATSNDTFESATRAFQRELVRRELAACDWNVREAARRLDVTRAYVYKLIRAFELKRDG